MSSPFIIKKITAAYWRASFNYPPFNLLGPEFFKGLSNIINELENDPNVKVIVFDSAVPDFFISHYDIQRGPSIPAEDIAQWPSMMLKLATMPVITVAALRGRARGAGSEFALACDIRFGSKEKLVLSQVEVSLSLLPGGGAIEWMPWTVNRGRLLEIICGSDEFDAETAEKYGWVNRAIPDVDFESFVDTFARRVAGWDKDSLVEAKKLINRRCGLPSKEDLLESYQVIGKLWTKPETGNRLNNLVKAGLERDREVELQVGDVVAKFPCL
jgi:enoyl-CoA hydratase/carnithine racemase